MSLQAVQPGALVISNGLEGHSMQSVPSPKLAQAGQATAQPSSSSMNPQAAQEAHALANASETLKAQAQTLKVQLHLACCTQLCCTKCRMSDKIHPRLPTFFIG